MNRYLETIRDRARKRALYRRTVAEIRSMPEAVAQDLGIYRGEAERIAHEAVYGR